MTDRKQRLMIGGKDTAVGAYSPGLRVGEMVFVSGQGPLNPETKDLELGSIEEQTRRVLQNVALVLREAGCTLDDCVKMTVHLRDINDFARFNEVYATFFRDPRPTRTTVQSVLPMGISVEIDAIAIRGCGPGAGD